MSVECSLTTPPPCPMCPHATPHDPRAPTRSRRGPPLTAPQERPHHPTVPPPASLHTAILHKRTARSRGGDEPSRPRAGEGERRHRAPTPHMSDVAAQVCHLSLQLCTHTRVCPWPPLLSCCCCCTGLPHWQHAASSRRGGGLHAGAAFARARSVARPAMAVAAAPAPKLAVSSRRAPQQSA